MPLTSLRDDHRRRVVITLSGEISLSELVGMLAHPITDGTWSWPAIYDGTNRMGVLTGAQVRALAGQAEMQSAVHGKRGPVAFVRKTPAGYGTARMLATLSEDHSPAAAAFEDRASAEEWLEQISSACRPGQRPVTFGKRSAVVRLLGRERKTEATRA